MQPKYFLLLCGILAISQTNAQKPFITTWNTMNIGVTDNTHIIFYATGDNFQVSWINMNDASDTGNVAGINGANTISFPVAGIYKVYIAPGNGSFSAITLSKDYTLNHDDGNKLLSIEQWGDIDWSTFNTAFANCQNMVMNAPDKPNLSNVTDMSAAFFLCRSLTTNAAMSNWDVSNVTNMSSMFSAAIGFNQPIGNWDVSNVTTMNRMFASAISFNQPIDNWDVGNVTDMLGMFYYAGSFNQPIGSWNVSNVTIMSQMFGQAGSFNQPIGNWNVGSVTTMAEMFSQASSFNQPIGNWNVSNVTNMIDMFNSVSNFDQSIGNWNVSNVVNMAGMFASASSFNQPIGNWDVGNVTDMRDMFGEASSFNQPISNWNVSNVVNMAAMFESASSFNQPIGNWTLSNATNMNSMFAGASSFNQPIGNWNVDNVADMSGMFADAGSFNQPIGNWNVGNVADISGMFTDAGSFNQPISNWNVGNVADMSRMFWDAGSFNQPIGNWNVSKVKKMDYMFYNAKNFNQSLSDWNFKNIVGYEPWNTFYMLDHCGMDCNNYGRTLRGWAANPELQNGMVLGAAGLTYDSAFAKAAHDSLTDIKDWIIVGDAMGHCSVILPVTFLSFGVTKQGNAALLTWSVANEINNKGYYVEKSTDGLHFNSIAFVAGKSAFKQTSYTYTDNNLTNGISYYRIKEVDNDGKFMHSGVQKIELPNFAWKINGNPVNNSFIDMKLDKPANISIIILSSNGNIIKAMKKGNLSAGNYNIPLNIDNVSAGIYIVRLIVDDSAYTSVVIKQ